MQLSKNFKLSEFTHSNTAVEHNIDNTPSPSEVANLKILCEKLLQPLRDVYARPMTISSGYRNKELNKKVGGVSTSQHMRGQAADVAVPNPRLLLDILMASGIEFDQAILYPSFLHLSYNEGKNRMQKLPSKGMSL